MNALTHLLLESMFSRFLKLTFQRKIKEPQLYVNKRLTSAILKFQPPCPSCICLNTSRLTSTLTLSPTENRWLAGVVVVPGVAGVGGLSGFCWACDEDEDDDDDLWTDWWALDPLLVIFDDPFSLLILRLLWWGGCGGGGRPVTVGLGFVGGDGDTTASNPVTESSLLINSECCLVGCWLPQPPTPPGHTGLQIADAGAFVVLSNCIWLEVELVSSVWPFDYEGFLV